MAVLVFNRSRQGGTQMRRLMSHPASTILATITVEDCMKEESSRTLARQWAMLRGIPRSPLRVTTGELEAKLADEGFAVSRRTLERDLHGLSGLFPLELDDRVRPYGWSWTKAANFEFMPKLTSSQAVALLLAKAHLRHLDRKSTR